MNERVSESEAVGGPAPSMNLQPEADSPSFYASFLGYYFPASMQVHSRRLLVDVSENHRQFPAVSEGTFFPLEVIVTSTTTSS